MAELLGAAVTGRDGVARDLPALAAAAAALAAELPLGRPGALVAFCFEHDHAAFTIALAATWARGLCVALPIDQRRAAVGGTLALPERVAFLHDTGAGTGTAVHERAWPEVAAGGRAAPTLEGDLVSSSPVLPATLPPVMQRLPIAAAALAEERAAWGRTTALPRGATLVVTHAPGHLPALVPGLLGPLQHGCRVVGAAGLPGDALAAHVRSSGATDVLTSPDRVRALARTARGALAPLQRVHTLGDVEPATVARLRAEHGVEVHTLRPATAAELAARPLAHALLAVPGVDDVGVARLQPPAEPARRVAVVAACGADAAALAAAAAGACPGEPAPLLHVVERLPRDHDGELPRDWVLHTVGRRADGSVPSRTLEWHDAGPSAATAAITATAGNAPVGAWTWCTKAALPAAYCGFDGHFTGHPVLSGSVQLHDLVLPALARARGRPVRVREIADLKFLARIAPADSVDVALHFAADGTSATFVLARGDVKCTTGRVVWAAEEA